MGTVFYAGYTFRTRLSIIALLPPSLANNIVVADVLSSGLSPCVPNLEGHGQALEGLHASLEGRSKPVVVMGCLYLHNGVECHLPVPVVTTTVCSVVVLHSPLISVFSPPLGRSLSPLNCCSIVEILGSACCAFRISTLDHAVHTSVAFTPTIRSSTAASSETREGVTRGNRERVSALLCCRPGRCLISNSCKASIHLVRRPFGVPSILAATSNFGLSLCQRLSQVSMVANS